MTMTTRSSFIPRQDVQCMKVIRINALYGYSLGGMKGLTLGL